jgi:hypothetical protein
MNIDASACTVRTGLSSGIHRGPSLSKIAADLLRACEPMTFERI